MQISFEWDDNKERENVRKHGVSFEEASTVFFNFPFRVFHDPDHSDEEDRLIAIGMSNHSKILLVVHCENTTGTLIRIISARKATPIERRKAFGELL